MGSLFFCACSRRAALLTLVTLPFVILNSPLRHPELTPSCHPELPHVILNLIQDP